MLGPRVAVRAGVDQDENVRFGGNDGRDAGTIDSRRRAQFDRGRGDGRTGVARADDGGRLRLFTRSTARLTDGIFLPPDGFDRAVASSSTTWVECTISIRRSLHLCFFSSASICGVSPTRKSLSICGYSRSAMTAPRDEIWWPEIAAHGVQSDFHRARQSAIFERANARRETRMKRESMRRCSAEAGLTGFEPKSGTDTLGCERLRLLRPSSTCAALVIPAGRAGGMRDGHAAASIASTC